MTTGEARATRGVLHVADLDGTLLRSDGTLGPFTVATINRAIENGVLFTYATARSFRSSRRVTAPLALRLPVMTYGGTVTADPDSGVPSDVRLLSEDTASAVVDASDRHPFAQPILFTMEEGTDWIRWDPDKVTRGTAEFLAPRASDPRLRPITRADPVDLASVFYVSVLGDRPDLIALRSDLEPALLSCAHFLSDDASTPGTSWFAMHHADGSKARAIQRLAARLGATRLVVFGDNLNDIPMFRIADESYAVANAVPELIEIASATIAGNDDEAVAHWLARNADQEIGPRPPSVDGR